MKKGLAALLVLGFCATAQAQDGDTTGGIGEKVDPDAYAITSEARGLNTHRPMYVYPATYTEDFHGGETELVFQLSGKWRVFGSDFWLAYTQKSFWQFVNNEKSSPFRETNHNPEVFYRWEFDKKQFNYWAVDIGAEHESNGKSFSDPVNFSRSWNRVYVAPFQAKGRHLAYLKFWYRLPEGAESSLGNQDGDDNPDITDYLGYGELTFSRQIGNGQLLSWMVRGNPATGHGATQLTWSVPSDEGWVFWGASIFHGYGESLISYDQEVTRFMVGMLLAR
jgi:phospholipase A1